MRNLECALLRRTTSTVTPGKRRRDWTSTHPAVTPRHQRFAALMMMLMMLILMIATALRKMRNRQLFDSIRHDAADVYDEEDDMSL